MRRGPGRAREATVSGLAPSHDPERPRGRVLLVVAILAAGGGFALARGSLAAVPYTSADGPADTLRAPASPADPETEEPADALTAPPPRPGDAPARRGASAPVGGSTGAEGDTLGAGGADADADGEERPGSSPPGADTPGERATRVVPGRMAYLRCDGAERPGARYPCPRDEVLEGKVWAAIEALPDCDLALPADADLDLRLEFRGGRQTEADLRGGDAAGRRAVAACLPGLSEGLQTRVAATRMVASFKFRLE